MPISKAKSLSKVFKQDALSVNFIRFHSFGRVEGLVLSGSLGGSSSRAPGSASPLCGHARTYDRRGKSHLHSMVRLGIFQLCQAFTDLPLYDILHWKQNNFLRLDRKG
ncbi:hypothetical protein ATANTOWER_019313 [Ataeniobius toweri]|uniref:Uncharacterized protein n=1 Tax=Ataeniobius toweri TaxID=208326 RepID=A0ABU7CJP6_9TELE|nr:hypothetical protein [Ataeniobius toweri]